VTRFESWPEDTISAELASLRAECNNGIITQSNEMFAQAVATKRSGKLEETEVLLDRAISLLRHPVYALVAAWLGYKGFTPDVAERITQWLQSDHKISLWMNVLTEMPDAALEQSVLAACREREIAPVMDTQSRQQKTNVYPRPGITVNIYAAHLERAICFMQRNDFERSLMYLDHAANASDAETCARTLFQRGQLNRALGLMIHAMDDFQEAQVRSCFSYYSFGQRILLVLVRLLLLPAV
jgi:tetratricopeptide (TPR) repeat protein